MKASELRVGNIISAWGTNGNPDGWQDQACTADNIATCCSHPDWFKGVPLPPEWTRKNYKVVLSESNGAWKTSLQPEIKYVHQLQNLYFAMTGEELTLQQPIPQ
jgi:hypothetical protein